MITVMQGILNVKLKSTVKAENVVRISEEKPKKHGARRLSVQKETR